MFDSLLKALGKPVSSSDEPLADKATSEGPSRMLNPFDLPMSPHGWDGTPQEGCSASQGHQGSNEAPLTPPCSDGGASSFEMVGGGGDGLSTLSCRSSMSIISMKELGEEAAEGDEGSWMRQRVREASLHSCGSPDSQEEANLILQGNIVDPHHALNSLQEQWPVWQSAPASPDPFLNPTHHTATNPVFDTVPSTDVSEIAPQVVQPAPAGSLLSWLRGAETQASSPAAVTCPTHLSTDGKQTADLHTAVTTPSDVHPTPAAPVESMDAAVAPPGVDMVVNPVFSAGGAGLLDEDSWELHIQAPSLAQLSQMTAATRRGGLLRARSLPLMTEAVVPDLIMPPLDALGQAIECLKDERDELADKLLLTDAALTDEQARRRQADADAAAQRALVAQLLAEQELLQQQLSDVERRQSSGGSAALVGTLYQAPAHLEDLWRQILTTATPALARAAAKARAFAGQHAASLRMIALVVSIVMCMLLMSWAFVQQGLKHTAGSSHVQGGGSSRLLTTQPSTYTTGAHRPFGARTCVGGTSTARWRPLHGNTLYLTRVPGFSQQQQQHSLMSSTRPAELPPSNTTTEVWQGCGNTCPSLPALFGIALPSAAAAPALISPTGKLLAAHMEHTCLPRTKRRPALPPSNALPSAAQMRLCCLNASPPGELTMGAHPRTAPMPYTVVTPPAPPTAQAVRPANKWQAARLIAVNSASKQRYQQDAEQQVVQPAAGRTARVQSQVVAKCWGVCSGVSSSDANPQVQLTQAQLHRIRLNARATQIQLKKDAMRFVLQDLQQALSARISASGLRSVLSLRVTAPHVIDSPLANPPHVNTTGTTPAPSSNLAPWYQLATNASTAVRCKLPWARGRSLRTPRTPAPSLTPDNTTFLLAIPPAVPTLSYQDYVELVRTQQRTHKLLAGLLTPPSLAPLTCILPPAIPTLSSARSAPGHVAPRQPPSLPLKSSAWAGRVQLPVVVRPMLHSNTTVGGAPSTAWSKLFHASQEYLSSLMSRHQNRTRCGCTSNPRPASPTVCQQWQFSGVIQNTFTSKRPHPVKPVFRWPAAIQSSSRFAQGLMSGVFNSTGGKAADSAQPRPNWPFERRRCRHFSIQSAAARLMRQVAAGSSQEQSSSNATSRVPHVSALLRCKTHMFKWHMKYLGRVAALKVQATPAAAQNSTSQAQTASKAVIRVESAINQLRQMGRKRRLPLWGPAVSWPVANQSAGLLGLQWLQQSGSALSLRALASVDEALIWGNHLMSRAANATVMPSQSSSWKAVMQSVTAMFVAPAVPGAASLAARGVNTSLCNVFAQAVATRSHIDTQLHNTSCTRCAGTLQPEQQHLNVAGPRAQQLSAAKGTKGKQHQDTARSSKAAGHKSQSHSRVLDVSELKSLRRVMSDTWSQVQGAVSEMQQELGRCFTCLGHESHSVCGAMSTLLGANKRWIDKAVHKQSGIKTQCPASASFIRACKCRGAAHAARHRGGWEQPEDDLPACCCLKGWKAAAAPAPKSSVLGVMQKLSHRHQLPWMRKVVKKTCGSHDLVEARAQEVAQDILQVLHLLNVSTVDPDWRHPTSSNTSFWLFASSQLSGRISGRASHSPAFRRHQRRALSKVATGLRQMSSALHAASSTGDMAAHVLSSSLSRFKDLQRGLTHVLNQLNLLQMRLGSAACSPRDPARRYVSGVRQQVQSMVGAVRQLMVQMEAGTRLCDASHTQAEELLPVIMSLTTRVALAREVQ